MKMTKHEVKELISEILEKGLTLSEIARKIEVADSTVSRWFNLHNLPTKRMIKQLQKINNRKMKHLKDWKLIVIVVLTIGLICSTWYGVKEHKAFNNLSAAGDKLIGGYGRIIEANSKMIADYKELEEINARGIMSYKALERGCAVYQNKAKALDSIWANAANYKGGVVMTVEGGQLVTRTNYK